MKKSIIEKKIKIAEGVLDQFLDPVVRGEIDVLYFNKKLKKKHNKKDLEEIRGRMNGLEDSKILVEAIQEKLRDYKEELDKLKPN